jgi:hypothetical protein
MDEEKDARNDSYENAKETGEGAGFLKAEA